MPRGRRVLVEGGLYHVYNRFARAEDVFADPEEAVDFLDLLREVKQRLSTRSGSSKRCPQF